MNKRPTHFKRLQFYIIYLIILNDKDITELKWNKKKSMFMRVNAFYNTTQGKLLTIKRCNIDFVSIQQSCKTDRKFPDILLKYFIKQYLSFTYGKNECLL